MSVPDKIDNLEGQSKRHNIIVDGIEESNKEKSFESEQKVRKIFTEKLILDHSKIELEWAHRPVKEESSQKHRPIVVKFLQLKDKLAVLDKTKHLKGYGRYINEDFPEAFQLKRKELFPAMKAARERGDIAYLRYQLINHIN